MLARCQVRRANGRAVTLGVHVIFLYCRRRRHIILLLLLPCSSLQNGIQSIRRSFAPPSLSVKRRMSSN